MKSSVIILFLIITSGFIFQSDGQPKSNKLLITGYVTDINYFPVAGAYIVIDGKTSDVLTDEKGFYKAKVRSDSKTIGVYSFKYGMAEEIINKRTRINFTFSNSISVKDRSLFNAINTEDEDDVNVGYGIKKRRELTTSVSKIDGTEKRFSAYNSIFEMLKGTVPGVLVNGDKVLIRGFTSIFGSNEPLYVVDGIPVKSIADISPQMVKSIEVLKGSAGSIYGSRGTNGVILIDQIDAPGVKKSTPVTAIKVPFADTRPATNVNLNSATLNADVNPNDLSAVVSFEYGPQTGYGSRVAASQSPVSGNLVTSAHAEISGLQPGTTYHYRVVADNSFGSTAGLDMSFITIGGISKVESFPVTKTTTQSAQLNGVVNPHDLLTSVRFEFGADENYESQISARESPLKGNSPVSVSAELSGLTAGTTYHYRIIATNELGIVYGPDSTFVANYKLGEEINGGYVFYIDEPGKHGLVCAPSNQSQSAVWGDCIPVGAAGRAVGEGYQNTKDIINGCSDNTIAARICYDLELNGYDDWYLPSVNELHLMYTNLHEKGLGGFKETFYWSSTQDKYGAWVVSFYYGSKSNHSRTENSILTRAIRAF